MNSIDELTYPRYKEVFYKYRDYLQNTNPKFLNGQDMVWNEAEGTINVMVIRCNDIYETNDRIRNNDWMVIIENRGEGLFRRHIFKCTADPKYRQDNIANLCEQMYYGNIRNHRGIFGRLAICQDNCKVWVRRYKGGNWIEEQGHFGINIHNPAGAFNSSLGCVILDTDSHYINEFRPLLKRTKGKVSVMVVNEKVYFELLKDPAQN